MNTRPHNRGSALIATMWVVVVITGLVLIMAKSMRIEAMATANRLAQAQSEATERGAEQFLLGAVESEVATPGSTANVGMEGRQIGDGYFWVMKPNPDDETKRAYGLTDEAGKLDLNTARDTMLQLLPNMPAAVGSSIVNWRGTTTASDGLGATSTDYESLKDPYRLKQSPFESTEEVSLILNMTPDLLYGLDRNRDGTVDTDEMKSGGSTPGSAGSALGSFGTNVSNRGIFPFITAYGQRATSSAGAQNTTTALVNINGNNTNRLRTLLSTYGVASAANIVSRTQAYKGRNNAQFASLFQWAIYVNLASGDFSKIFTHITCTVTGGTTRSAKINVNTAPQQVLLCLPGLQQSDVSAIVSHRQTNTTSNPADISWMLDAVSHSVLQLYGGYFTGSSTIYSGDIVAVSPDGRAFKRFRIVIDGSKVPAYIIYRRDLTSNGWPLPSDIRDALRNGNPPPDANASANSGSLVNF